MEIPVNLGDTPDEVLPLSAGTRTFDVVDVETETHEKHGTIVVAKLKVNEDDSPENGRSMTHRFFIKHQPAQVAFKQFVKACGLDGNSNVSTDELIGCTCQAVVNTRTYEDKDTGDTKEAANIKEFLWK